jgi:hypothetical protein
MGLGLVICAASHIFPALLAGLALGLVLVSRHWKLPRTLFVQLTALFIASVPTLLLVAASTATAEADSDGSVQAAWHSVSGRLPVLARLLVAGEAWRTWPLLAVVALGLLCAWFRPGRLRADQRAILWLGTLCLALFVLAPAFFTPQTPWVWMMVLLFLGGLSRSLQFTGINAVGYSDVPSDRLSSATSFSSVLQQLSGSIGIAVAAFGLEAMQGQAGPIALSDFPAVFAGIALLSLLSVIPFARLDASAGANLLVRDETQRDP